MNIANRLKEVRNEIGLTQTEFAKKMGITQTSLSMLESGQRPITERHIKVISSIFGVNEIWLKTGNGDVFTSSPYEEEFMRVFSQLNDVTQEHLLAIANNLLEAEKGSNSDEEK